MPATTIFDQMKAAVADVIAFYKEAAKDGLTLNEVWSLTTKAVGTLVTVAEGFKEFGGADKKAAVLAAAGEFYDAVLAPIDIPKVPDFLERTVVDPALRQVWLKVVDGMVDGLVGIFNKTQWPTLPAAPAPAQPGTPAAPTLPGWQPY